MQLLVQVAQGLLVGPSQMAPHLLELAKVARKDGWRGEVEARHDAISHMACQLVLVAGVGILDLEVALSEAVIRLSQILLNHVQGWWQMLNKDATFNLTVKEMLHPGLELLQQGEQDLLTGVNLPLVLNLLIHLPFALHLLCPEGVFVKLADGILQFRLCLHIPRWFVRENSWDLSFAEAGIEDGNSCLHLLGHHFLDVLRDGFMPG